MSDVDLKKERILRWKLEQQLAQKSASSFTPNTTKESHELLVDDDTDPLDAYMNSLQATSVVTPSNKTQLLEDVEKSDEIQQVPDMLDLDSQDVIGNAIKKPKLILSIPSGPPPPSLLVPFRKCFLPDEFLTSNASKNSVIVGNEKVTLRGSKPPLPILKWEHCGISRSVLELLRKKLEFSAPTPIQSYALACLLAGRDTIGIAKTGSGKTLAYVLPLIRHVLDQRAVGMQEGPIALVLAPTRELALQIHAEVQRFSQGSRIRSIACYGGPPIKDQIAMLKRGAEIVVSTPGRMIDLLVANSGRVSNLHRVSMLVLDEADRMMDAGFEPQVMQLIQCTRPDRQTVMFSATFPRAMEALARRILRDPLEVAIQRKDSLPATARLVVCEDVDQRVVVVEEEDKFPLLLKIIGSYHVQTSSQDSRILVFVERQEGADNLLRDLIRRGYPCLSLHGGKDQSDRDCTIADFRNGIIPLLVATSVAARGLDVPGLGLVINYDCPNHAEDYVHRVGRTGRAGSKGTAYTFITPEQSKYAKEICKVLRASSVPIPADVDSLSESHAATEHSNSANAGFGGKGLVRLDSDRECIKNAQKAAFLINEVPVADQPTSISEKLPQRMRESHESPFVKPLQAAISAVIDRLVEVGVAPPSRTFNIVDPVQMLNERFGYSGESGSGDIVPVPETVNATSTQSSAPARTNFCCEILINDYGQQARWRVTNRDTLSALIYQTATAITVRGTFIPPGSAVSTDRKLYLYVEGESREAVQRARDEIKRMLNADPIQ